MLEGISFILPTFNSEKTLTSALDSIVNGNLDIGDEIIVVDDCSSDNTLSIVNSYLSKYKFIRLLKHNVNKGSAAATRNTGIEVAKNRLLFCLDSDNILVKGSIKKLKNYLVLNRLDAAAFGEIHYFKDDVDNITNVWVLDEEITFIRNINFMEKSPTGSGNYLFTKDSWIKAGRYNESVGGAWDSWAFGCSQLAAGCKMRTLRNTFYYHRQGYESTYILENRKLNYSLNVARILIPYLHLLHPLDVSYIFNPCYRYTWVKNVKRRSIREKKDRYYLIESCMISIINKLYQFLGRF